MIPLPLAVTLCHHFDSGYADFRTNRYFNTPCQAQRTLPWQFIGREFGLVVR